MYKYIHVHIHTKKEKNRADDHAGIIHVYIHTCIRTYMQYIHTNKGGDGAGDFARIH